MYVLCSCVLYVAVMLLFFLPIHACRLVILLLQGFHRLIPLFGMCGRPALYFLVAYDLS